MTNHIPTEALASTGAASVTSMSATVVVVGSLNADLVVRTPRFPRAGETVMGTGFSMHRGGKGANQAVAAARSCAHVVMIGRLGNDTHATYLREGLRADGVDDRFVGNCKHDPSGVALITVDVAGENTIVVVPGANHLLRPVHVDDAFDAGVFAGPGLVMLAQLEVSAGVVQRAFELGRAKGALNVLNAAPADDVPDALIELVDVLVVNEHELRLVQGTDDLDAALSAASQRVPWVVLTLGAAGARLVGAAADVHLAAHRVAVVDTTGAGDAFCGAFAAAWSMGSAPLEALQRANAAGALATTVHGAQPSAPTAVAVDALLAAAS